MHRWYEPDDLFWDDEFTDIETGMDNVHSDVSVRKVVVMGYYTGGATDTPDIDDDDWEYERTWLEWLVEVLDWLKGWYT
jgi:hypothetical protein